MYRGSIPPECWPATRVRTCDRGGARRATYPHVQRDMSDGVGMKPPPVLLLQYAAAAVGERAGGWAGRRAGTNCSNHLLDPGHWPRAKNDNEHHVPHKKRGIAQWCTVPMPFRRVKGFGSVCVCVVGGCVRRCVCLAFIAASFRSGILRGIAEDHPPPTACVGLSHARLVWVVRCRFGFKLDAGFGMSVCTVSLCGRVWCMRCGVLAGGENRPAIGRPHNW